MAKKKKAPAKAKPMPKRKPKIQPATKAEVGMLSARLDAMERELKELSKRAAADTDLDMPATPDD
jgi:hypothetical protein